eukprot:gene17719-biopygen8095
MTGACLSGATPLRGAKGDDPRTPSAPRSGIEQAHCALKRILRFDDWGLSIRRDPTAGRQWRGSKDIKRMERRNGTSARLAQAHCALLRLGACLSGASALRGAKGEDLRISGALRAVVEQVYLSRSIALRTVVTVACFVRRHLIAGRSGRESKDPKRIVRSDRTGAVLRKNTLVHVPLFVHGGLSGRRDSIAGRYGQGLISALRVQAHSALRRPGPSCQARSQGGMRRGSTQKLEAL